MPPPPVGYPPQPQPVVAPNPFAPAGDVSTMDKKQRKKAVKDMKKAMKSAGRKKKEIKASIKQYFGDLSSDSD